MNNTLSPTGSSQRIVEPENVEEIGHSQPVPAAGISVELAKLTTLAAVAAERDAYLRQLTVVQAECTRLLKVQRVLRQDLLPLAERLVEAREKHPEGTGWGAFWAEWVEFIHAVRHESIERIESELLDVMVCGLRIILGGDPQ